jgi:hypothetical protein
LYNCEKALSSKGGMVCENVIRKKLWKNVHAPMNHAARKAFAVNA